MYVYYFLWLFMSVLLHLCRVHLFNLIFLTWIFVFDSRSTQTSHTYEGLTVSAGRGRLSRCLHKTCRCPEQEKRWQTFIGGSWNILDDWRNIYSSVLHYYNRLVWQLNLDIRVKMVNVKMHLRGNKIPTSSKLNWFSIDVFQRLTLCYLCIP